MSESDQNRIDDLLERYLGLVDEYTRLRDDLSRLQRSMFQDVARANFSAERGVRYGQDQYDERMQASRKLDIGAQGPNSLPLFTVAPVPKEENEAMVDGEKEDKEDKEANEDANNDANDSQEKEASKKNAKTVKDPLRWYGLFAPPALRSAQTTAIQTVEDTIPRLVTVNAEMLEVEIQIRRAKKKRAKAEATGKKQQSNSENMTAVGVDAS